MRHRAIYILPALLLTVWFAFSIQILPVDAEDPVVHAVLFYSPTCPHCHQVIQEVLPPLMEKYGNRLQIIGIDTTTQEGSAMFNAAVVRFGIPPDRQAVPMLIVGETILLGSYDIPEQFPMLIERHLAEGGIEWPEIPGLQEAVATAQAGVAPSPEPTLTLAAASTEIPQATKTQLPSPAPTVETRSQPEIASTVEASPQPTPTATHPVLLLPDNSHIGMRERLARDPAGNLLAILVLIGILISLGISLQQLGRYQTQERPGNPSVWVPALCVLGIVVAGYLAYVETLQVEAVCGPVGDCNTVQQSKFAYLFGILPVGVLGIAGYIAMLVMWLIGRFGSAATALLASLSMLGMSLFGVLFSIYLTFLEPFVIGATCAWCLTSAIIMTALLWFSLSPAKAAFRNLYLE